MLLNENLRIYLRQCTYFQAMVVVVVVVVVAAVALADVSMSG